MTSKLVADRIAILRTVRSSLLVHAPEVVADLEKVLFPAGTPPNLTVEAFLAALEQALARYSDELIAKDDAHAAELADDDGYRTRRDQIRAELRNYLSSLRDTLARNYGPGVAIAYGLNGVLPDETQTLLNVTCTASKLLKSRPLTESPRNKSLKIDPLAAAQDLDDYKAALEAALNDVEREKREAQITLAAKEQEIARWPVVYSGIADTSAALFVLAGRSDLAERVRPTARRRAGEPEAEDTTPPAGNEAGTPTLTAGQATSSG